MPAAGNLPAGGIVYIEGNNGGDYIIIEDAGDGLIRLEVGHCCVIVMKHIVPIEFVTSALARVLLETDNTPEGSLRASEWSRDFVDKLVDKVERIEIW